MLKPSINKMKWFKIFSSSNNLVPPLLNRLQCRTLQWTLTHSIPHNLGLVDPGAQVRVRVTPVVWIIMGNSVAWRRQAPVISKVTKVNTLHKICPLGLPPVTPIRCQQGAMRDTPTEGLNPIQICMVEVSSNNIRHLEDGINKDPTLISSGILLKNFSETFISNYGRS